MEKSGTELFLELPEKLNLRTGKIGGGFSDLVGDLATHKPPSDPRLQNMAEGAGLRQLQAFLNVLDSSKHWGGLRRVLAPTGDYLWVCKEHYLEFDPALPDKGFDLRT